MGFWQMAHWDGLTRRKLSIAAPIAARLDGSSAMDQYIIDAPCDFPDALMGHPDLLRSRAMGRPRINGNGFLQLDVDDYGSERRLHIWHPSLPQQKVATPIHDHRFSFTSQVLYGVQESQRYTLQRGTEITTADLEETYQIHKVVNRDREDTILVPTGETVGVQGEDRLVIPMGHQYHFPAHDFHATPVSGMITVTWLTKTYIDPSHETQVLVKSGFMPDNEFNRYDWPDEYCWNIIKQSIMLAQNSWHGV